jgi:uncharacterized repeat protein (TIGR03987 family)
MNTLSIIGAVTVTLALISYSIGILSEQLTRKIIPRVMIFVTLGVILDITATLFMILGSRNSPFTFHGSIGYSALLVMLFECFFLWRLKAKKGLRVEVPNRLHRYSLIAYIWWIIAYITGSLIALT